MNFDDFSNRISKIENLPLPGEASHYKMAPLIRKQWFKSNEIANFNPKKAAVLALMYPNQEYRTNILLILRKAYEGIHSNQIGFPGGKTEEADKDLMATALRETYEEVGVPPENVKVIRSLTELYIPPSNFEVQPYIGLYKKTVPFKIQETEVEALIEVPLMDFMDDRKIFSQKLRHNPANIGRRAICR